MYLHGEIFTIDEPEGTVYVLFRPGVSPVMAAWPQHLWHVAPRAKQMGTLGGEEWHTGLNGHVSHNPPIEGCSDGGAAPMMSSVNVVYSARSHRTFSRISLIDNRDESFEKVSQGLDEQQDQELRDESRWVTLCDTHGNYVLHRTKTLAVSHMGYSDDWCEECTAREGK